MKTAKKLIVMYIILMLTCPALCSTLVWVGTDDGNEGDWSVAANWTPAKVPVNSDDVYLENSSQSVTAGLDQSAVALSTLNIAQSYTGNIGTSTAYLQAGAAVISIGYHFGPGQASGSGMIKLDVGTSAPDITVYNSGISSDTTKPAVRLKANHANTTLEVRKGEVGLAVDTNETSTIGTINIGYVDDIETDASVYIGSGVTLTNLTKKGGECMLLCAATTIKNYNGTLTTEGSGAITTLSVYDGTVTSNSTGTITTCNISNEGVIDFSKSQQARTVTTCKVDDKGAVKFDPAIITFTNKIISNEPVTFTASGI